MTNMLFMNAVAKAARKLKWIYFKRLPRASIGVGEEIERVANACSAEVISIDLFDTVVFRRCVDPLKVFLLQYRALSHLLPTLASPDAWVAVRKQHELQLSKAAHPFEITLDDIYAAIGDDLGLADEVVTDLKAAELEIEFSVIRPYGFVVDALARLRNAGKQIVITTDTYLPQAFISRVLQTHLPFLVTLLCSSETQKPKQSGLAFKLLRETYPDKQIVHFGDNLYSDLFMVGSTGVKPFLVDWMRAQFLKRNQVSLSHLSSLGVHTFDTPFDRLEASDGDATCRQEVAWRWAVVLLDVLLEIKQYASEIQADEIWFLSRDMESVFHSVSDFPKYFGSTTIKYVRTSRAATYPIMAVEDSQRFKAYAGREATEADREKGHMLIKYYRSVPNDETQRILIVDTGWKGRIQVALQAALPEKTFFGFYLSLMPESEPETKKASRAFKKWDGTVINQAGAEALAGFKEASCIGYSRGDDGCWVPLYRPIDPDVSPADYCFWLRKCLNSFLNEVDLTQSEPSEEMRTRSLKQILKYPDQIVSQAFCGWSIASSVAGDSVETLLKGGRASLLQKLLGMTVHDNIWPEIAIWGICERPSAVLFLQALLNIRKQLQAYVGITK